MQVADALVSPVVGGECGQCVCPMNESHLTVVLINTREPEIAAPHIGLACGALEGLQKIDALQR